MSNIDELKQLSKELFKLLDDPAPGSQGWHEAVHDKIRKIAAFHED